MNKKITSTVAVLVGLIFGTYANKVLSEDMKGPLK